MGNTSFLNGDLFLALPEDPLGIWYVSIKFPLTLLKANGHEQLFFVQQPAHSWYQSNKLLSTLCPFPLSTSHPKLTSGVMEQRLRVWISIQGLSKEIRQVSNDSRCRKILLGCITAWCGNCSSQDCKKSKVCRGHSLIHHPNQHPPQNPIDFTYTPHCPGKAANVIKDHSHPSPIRQAIQKSLKAQTTRFKDNLIFSVIRHLNRSFFC